MAGRWQLVVIRLRLLIWLFVIGLVAASSALAGSAGSFTARGTVDYVVDGDTVEVRLDGGRRERVRLIGIDAPERSDCGAARATAAARALALERRVTLKGDPTQATRDRYGRLLAYVWLPGGRDLGYQLLAKGLVRVYVYDRPFQRLSAYRRAEAAGRGHAPSCAVPQPLAGTRCDPSYPGVCIPPPPPDLDCADVPYSAFRVVGADPHRFDGDGDGVGCEG